MALRPERSAQRLRDGLWSIKKMLGDAQADFQIREFRFESFGGIVQLPRPQGLVFVDRDFVRSLKGVSVDSAEQSHWSKDETTAQNSSPTLGAPLEAHVQLTNRCDAGCQGCYTSATPQGHPNELSLQEWKDCVDKLADMGVFHLALGGGESAVLPWLGELVHHIRKRGIIPNLTTSGLAGLDRLLPIAHLFGQINVSLDGLADQYREVRGFDGFDKAKGALQLLRARTKKVGINVVVTQQNFEDLAEIFSFAKSLKLNEVELLRFKPSGRGKASYSKLACTKQQHLRFLPEVLQASRQSKIRVRVDCSYTPMLAWHEPGQDLLEALCVYGCTGGDFLVGARANGRLSACSFAQVVEPQLREEGPKISQLQDYWHRKDAFGEFRQWQQPQKPCDTCNYQSLCRGGCRVVSAHLAGSQAAPDPECPRVIEWQKRNSNTVRLPVLG